MRRSLRSVLVVVTLVGSLLATMAPASWAAPAGASRFVRVDPTRVLDTRSGIGAPIGVVAPGRSVDLATTWAAPVPAGNVTAVVLNVTAVDSTGPGFVQVYPTGTNLEGKSSNLNVESVGQTIPNLVVVPVGAGGRVTVYTQGGGHLVADVFGFFVTASTATDGRYKPLQPSRLLDTRTTGKLAANASVKIPVRGVGGVPGSGAGAAVLNVTADDATAPGFVQVIHTGGSTAVGASSNLNLGRAGQTIPNLVIVPIGADGSVTVYTESGTHLLVDVLGYFTDASVAVGEDGLFVPVTPDRMLDTRSAAKPAAGAHTVVAPLGKSSIPSTGVAAVFGNLTATQAATGWVQVLPGGSLPSEVGRYSNVNVDHNDQTIPNAAMANLGTDGKIDLYTSSSTHLLFDVAGWFTTAPVVPPVPPTPLTITVTSPTGGVLTGSQTVTATTTGTDVLGVQFKLNGSDLGSEDTTAPYSTQWVTSRVPNATYSLTAVVRRAGDSVTSAVRTVRVSNAIVTLTFDDGWESHIYAAQELASRNMAGTFYVMSQQSSEPFPRPYLSLVELLGIKNLGHEMASHTVDHVDLTTLTPTQVTDELVNSKTALEAAFPGTSITNFATPYGSTNTAVTNAVKAVYGSQRSVSEGINLPSDRTNYTVSNDGYIDTGSGGWIPFDRYNLHVRNIIGVAQSWGPKTTAPIVQGWLDDLKGTQAVTHTAQYQSNAWMVIVFHEITTTSQGGPDYTATPAEFESYLDLIEASGVRVLTMQQALIETTAIH